MPGVALPRGAPEGGIRDAEVGDEPPHSGNKDPIAVTPGEILKAYRIFAVVGLSPRPGRPSHGVASFLQERGYRIIPVNPEAGVARILGEIVHPNLLSVTGPVEVVDIFRRSEFVPPVVDQAIAIGAKAIWMQLGVVHEEAAAKARAAGLAVVMDRCPAIELRRAPA